jgi:hypothetical protein
MHAPPDEAEQAAEPDVTFIVHDRWQTHSLEVRCELHGNDISEILEVLSVGESIVVVDETETKLC